MPSRSRASLALLPVIVLAAPMVAGCESAAPPATAPAPADTGTVHLPTTAAPTTDASGHPVERLPVPPPAPMSEHRVRRADYSFAVPVGWSVGDSAASQADPPPDTLVLPDDESLPALLAVERPFKAGSVGLAGVADRLRAGFVAKGFAPKSAVERDIAGYHAQGLVIDQSPELRHLYYVVVYTDKVFAIRLSYDPSSPGALGVLEGVLASWSWG